ncbi:MAG: plasmid replication protein, CyRepA1 family, partial [Crocosphaera sp.]
MSKYIPTRSNNPCPICGDIKGKCRTFHDSELVLCMTGAGGLIDAVGYKYRKDTADGTWGIYAPDNQENFDSSEYQRQKQERAEKRAEAERLKRETHRKEALPIKKRNKHYRRIRSYLGLCTEHQQDLLNRGLNESQIEKLSSFTVNGITELPDRTPLNLPCVRISKTGQKYFSSYNINDSKETKFTPSRSYFFPAFDFDGNIIGGQFRHNRKHNKYTWLTGIKKNNLPNGEIPITIIKAEKVTEVKCPLDFSKFGENIKPLEVLEGLLKPFISTCKWGIDSIGASGFNFSNSQQQVSEAVKRGGYNLAIFALDAGLIKNDNLLVKLKKNIKLFESLGCQIAIAWWGQSTKESPDFDELESLENVKLLTLDEFKQVLIEEKLEEDKLNKLFYNLQHWIKCQEKKQRNYYKSLKKKLKANITENSRYCTAPYVLNNLPEDFWGILNLISAKGTGKSTVIGSYYHDKKVNYLLPDKPSLISKYQQKGYNVISLSLRIALSEEQAHRWNLKFINSDKPKLKYKFATEYTEIALVIDSLLYLVNRSIDEKLVLVIDEVKSFITHLLTSNTLKENRHLILKQFEKIIKLIYDNQGLIILSDADMGQAELDYFQNVSAKVNSDKFPTFTYENTFKHEGREANLFEKKSDLLTVVHNLLKEDKRLIFPCDSIKEAQALAEVLNKDFPQKNIFCINSESVENDNISREFVTKPNESVKSLKPDVLLYTNSMGMGVSINIAKSFDYVICLADGTLTPDGVRQAIWRYRELVDILLYCPTQSHRYSSDIPFNVIECHKRIETLSKGSIKVSELLKSLYDCDSNYLYYKKILSLFDENQCLNDPHLKQIALIYSMQNYEFKNYRECILDDLKEIENNKVITNQEEVLAKFGLDDIENNFGKDSRDQKSGNKKKHSHNLSGSRDIPFKQAVEMSKRSHLTPEQRLQVEKAFLKHRFGDLADDPEFCFFATRDGGRNLNKIAFEFFCQNFEISKFYDRKNWHD